MHGTLLTTAALSRVCARVRCPSSRWRQGQRMMVMLTLFVIPISWIWCHSGVVLRALGQFRSYCLLTLPDSIHTRRSNLFPPHSIYFTRLHTHQAVKSLPATLSIRQISGLDRTQDSYEFLEMLCCLVQLDMLELTTKPLTTKLSILFSTNPGLPLSDLAQSYVTFLYESYSGKPCDGVILSYCAVLIYECAPRGERERESHVRLMLLYFHRTLLPPHHTEHCHFM